MNFGCTSCGECCKRIIAYPDWPRRADGKACVHLAEDDKTCLVYETRPRLCRIDDMKPEGLSSATWYNRNATVCNRMQAEAGIGVEMRVAMIEESDGVTRGKQNASVAGDA